MLLFNELFIYIPACVCVCLNKFADGCVIGSALVKFIEEFSQIKISEKKMLNNISDFLEKLQK